ncbi:HD domain-containing protein [Paenibacillus sp. KACC 21273]|uniref:HD-GYP domain-containing protein n=1 Tax=Paenibacillus sp. KACC 21273 TaxID=3025665 RepID=UPI0023651D2F|nr:HD domain-containing phosphohydrolase [Paenibacillus sp. KACC 21273]WDF52053.1 HD domain-containing protein [Paenibacillus sp. KACC 21273]
MIIHITELKQGQRLSSDTFNSSGVPLLKKGVDIKEEDITLLLRHKVEYVDIEAKEEIKPVANMIAITGLSPVLKEKINRSIDAYQSIFLEALTKGKFNADVVDELLQPLLLDLDAQKDVVALLLHLEKEDDHLYSHSLKVGLLSYYIAEWLDYSKHDCYRISKAGYLHDIGKSRLPSILRSRPEELNASELKEYKNHTTYGYDIIMESMNDKVTASVALQHHERGDGSGYPNRLYKRGIHPFTQIVSVADVFVNMTAAKNEQNKQGFVAVLQSIYELGFSKLNEKPVQALIHHLAPNLIGKKVQLTNGEHGTIILNNPLDIFRPLVQIDDQFVDLTKVRELHIEEIFV